MQPQLQLRMGTASPLPLWPHPARHSPAALLYQQRQQLPLACQPHAFLLCCSLYQQSAALHARRYSVRHLPMLPLTPAALTVCRRHHAALVVNAVLASTVRKLFSLRMTVKLAPAPPLHHWVAMIASLTLNYLHDHK